MWTWFAAAWTYAVLAVPILLLPAVLRRRDDPVLRAATYLGATSVVLSLVGFLRWMFVVPPLSQSYVTGDATARAAVDAAWTAGTSSAVRCSANTSANCSSSAGQPPSA